MTLQCNVITGRGVTANMLALGASDSGFESRRPDQDKSHHSIGGFCYTQRTPKFHTGFSHDMHSVIQLRHCFECGYIAPNWCTIVI